MCWTLTCAALLLLLSCFQWYLKSLTLRWCRSTTDTEPFRALSPHLSPHIPMVVLFPHCVIVLRKSVLSRGFQWKRRLIRPFFFLIERNHREVTDATGTFLHIDRSRNSLETWWKQLFQQAPGPLCYRPLLIKKETLSQPNILELCRR